MISVGDAVFSNSFSSVSTKLRPTRAPRAAPSGRMIRITLLASTTAETPDDG
jgi:hypothetical protein